MIFLDIGNRNLYINRFIIILYHDFARNIFGILYLKFRFFFIRRFFGSGSPKSIVPVNSSYNNMLIYMLFIGI